MHADHQLIAILEPALPSKATPLAGVDELVLVHGGILWDALGDIGVNLLKLLARNLQLPKNWDVSRSTAGATDKAAFRKDSNCKTKDFRD